MYSSIFSRNGRALAGRVNFNHKFRSERAVSLAGRYFSISWTVNLMALFRRDRNVRSQS